ncbi:MAG: Rieske 2Fe-2S domain-containing protein [Alphaproteobacteria bacterium]
MLSREDNELLTSIGPGTSAGTLLRRYWQPIAAAVELTDENPIMKVRILGEDLVLYKGANGGFGLVAEQCPHRFASLSYGRVEDDCIRCPYHGWKFDAAGRCVEMPAEPNAAAFKDTAIHTAYPVRPLGGMLFAYMGPAPVPALPKWDVLAWQNGRRWIRKFAVLNCNWLQCMENSVDPSHLYWLHGSSAHLAKVMDHYEEQHDFITFDYGIMKRRTTAAAKPGGRPMVDQHPLLFPNILRHVASAKGSGTRRHNLQCRIPIDDTHTQIYIVNFQPDASVVTPSESDVPMEHFNFRDETGRYRMDQVPAQDAMAWETQGPVMDRTRERLGAADKGIVTYRRLLKQQIELVQAGGTPLGVEPEDAEKPIIELEVINERIGLERPEEVRGAA